VRLLEEHHIEDIAAGSAVLGTGGGGDPYLGKLATKQAIRKNGPIKLVTADELPDDTMVVSPFGIGSPVPFLERICLTKELEYAYAAMTKFLGKPVGAIISAEIGGMNSVIPLAVASELGLPVIDADFMGRAFPEIQLVTATLYGHAVAPLAMADPHGNVVVIDSIDNHFAERFARPTAVEMGAIAGGVGFPLTIKDIKEAAVLGTVTFAEQIGKAIHDAQRNHTDPVRAVTDTTKGHLVFQGRIVDVSRKTERGWALGETIIEGQDEYAGRRVTVRFQNEHLVVIENDEIIVSVPDLIAILDSERGDPITTESLRYGFRVSVIGMPSDEKWRTPAGIELAGPRHFGYDIDFVPVEQRFGN
jgi:uncharacterized protein